jgi:hypothetical protein
MSTAALFSQSYAEARAKFRAAAEARQLDVHAQVHPLLGRDGEELAMDVARDGPRDARRVLIISSACHGVEGFCGSGIQMALLQDEAWHRSLHDAGVAVLYIHALNPYGFSWWRRTTQENVDLNRNFHDFSQALPANPGYDEIATWLVPSHWPPSPEVDAAITRFVAERGERAFQAAVSGGQYDHPEGLFYGGRNPTWSHVALRHVLQDHAAHCERLAWIDLHTGLGPNGVGELIFAGDNADAEGLKRARRWWGAHVTSLQDGTSVSAPLTGLMWTAVYGECPQAEYTGIAVEYGTVPVTEVITALRADQWLEMHPEASDAQRRAIKRQVRDAFYTDTEGWKDKVVEQGLAAARLALKGLSDH